MTGTNNAEVWEWNGTSWTQRDIGGPMARNSHAMAYDTTRHACVLFGGSIHAYNGSGTNAETWTLGYTSCPADFDHNGFVNGDDYDAFAVLFDVADPGADFNGDGFVNANDFDEFSENFEVGC